MEQERYQLTAKGETFRPDKAPDYVAEFDEAIAQSNQTRELYEQSVRTRARQEVDAAEYQLNEIGELSELSATLMDSLISTQKKVNESQKAAGLADRLRQEFDPEGSLGVDTEEQLLAEGQEELNKTADQYERSGGNRENKNIIRNQGGWYGYGQYIGSMTLMGEQFPLALERAKAEGFSINIDGKEITPETATTDAEYRAWQNAVAQEYLKQAPDASDEVAGKYLLNPMRRSINEDALVWSTANNERIESEQKDGAISGLYANLTAKDPNAINSFFQTYPGTKKEAREALNAYLQGQVKAGAMSKEEALRLYDESPITWNDGSTTTLSAQFPQERNVFESDLEAKETAAIAQDAQADNALVQKLVNDVKSVQRQMGRSLTDNELKEFKDQLPPGIDPKVLDDAVYTVEESRLDNARETLEELYEAGQLTPEKLALYPPSIQAEFAEKAQTSSQFSRDLQGSKKRMEDDAEAAARAAVSLSDGAVTTKSTKYLRANREAKRIFKEAYMKARRQGMDNEQALDFATQTLQPYAVADSALTKEPPKITLSQKAQEARKFIKENNGNYNTLIPDTKDQLKTAVEFLRTGKGSMPGLYSALAEGQYFTARELVIAQAQSAGMDIKDIKLPEAELSIQEFPPEVKELLNRYQSPARTTQAIISPATGDAKWVLDAIASKESGAAGYNAVNQIGLAGGHSTGAELGAFSGDFRQMSQHNGRDLTTMTVGEIMDLQDNTGANRLISDGQWIAAGRLHAVGRYQIISDTMRILVSRLGISPDTKFDAKTQDMMALELIKMRAESGNLSSGLRSEWIGLQYMNPERYATLVAKAQRIVASPYNDPSLITPGVL